MLLVFFGLAFWRGATPKKITASTHITARLADSISNVLAIKSHGAENTEFTAFKNNTEKWRSKSLSSMRGFLLVSGGYATLMATLNISAVVIAIWAAQHSLVSLASVYRASLTRLLFHASSGKSNNVMRNYNRIIGDAHDMTEILAIEPEIQDISSKKLYHQRRRTYREHGFLLCRQFPVVI